MKKSWSQRAINSLHLYANERINKTAEDQSTFATDKVLLTFRCAVTVSTSHFSLEISGFKATLSEASFSALDKASIAFQFFSRNACDNHNTFSSNYPLNRNIIWMQTQRDIFMIHQTKKYFLKHPQCRQSKSILYYDADWIISIIYDKFVLLKETGLYEYFLTKLLKKMIHFVLNLTYTC